MWLFQYLDSVSCWLQYFAGCCRRHWVIHCFSRLLSWNGAERTQVACLCVPGNGVKQKQSTARQWHHVTAATWTCHGHRGCSRGSEQSVQMCLCEIRVRSMWMLLCLHDTLNHLCQYRPPWFTREGKLWVCVPQPTPWAFPLLLSTLHRSFSPQTAQRSLSSERPKQRHKATKPGATLMHVEELWGELVHFCTSQGLSLATALSPAKKKKKIIPVR